MTVTLTFISDDKPLFRVEGSLEYIAGAAVGGTDMVRVMNEQKPSGKYSLQVTSSNGTVKLSEFRALNSVHTNFLHRCSSGKSSCAYYGSFMLKRYGIWVKGFPSRGTTYSLYSFDTLDFLSGLEQICKYFDTEFQTLVYDAPFDREGTYIDTPYNFQSGVLFSVHIEDAEIDIDEAGDENISDPYASFDDFDN